MKSEEPHFSIRTKVGTEYVDVPSEKNVTGSLKNIQFSEYEWEGKKIKTLKIVIDREEKQQLCIIDSSYTTTLRGIINSLLGCNEPINKISITLFKNKQGFNGAYTIINSKKSNWKYSGEELKKYVDIENTKKFGPVADYDRLDNFLEDELKKHLNVIIPNMNSSIDSILSENKPVITEKIVDNRTSKEYNDEEDLFDFDK